MKTKILILLLLFVTAFCLAFGVAGCDNKTPQGGGDDVGGESDESEELEFNEINDGELSGYSVSLGTVRVSPIVIPAVYNNLPVISIGEKAFYGYRGKSISIPESVTSVENGAFDGCASLESITVDENNPSYASVDGILYNKDKTEFKHVPMAVIGPVRIPAGVVSVGGFVFYGRTSLESITIPESVTSIGIDAFRNCISLKEINIGNGVISIGNNAFNNTAYYNASQNWINDVLYIGEYLIQARESIAGNCEIAAGTKLVANSAFFGCENLSSVTVGGKVEFIGNYAFRGCKNLKSIAFADSVKSVGTFAFYGCEKLEKVVAKDPGAWCNMGVSADYSNPLYYAHNLYIDDNLATDFEIPQKVTEIKANAFAGCTSIESITIPNGVVSIGTEAFSGCSGLAEIAVPDSVTSIGFGAFENCTAAIKWGSNPAINKFDGSVFYGYGGTSIAIPKSVTSVENGAFDGCTNLESITVDPNNLAYSGSEGILFDKTMTEIVKVPQAKTSVTIPKGVAVIGENAFAGCTKLTEIALPDSVETVKNGAFDGCPRLESISVGTGNQNYASQNGILYNKAKTDFVYIPKRVSGAVVIPDGITSIAEEAFKGCYGIESITIPDTVTLVGKDAFGGCTNIETATLPAHAIGFIPKDSLQTVILTSGKNLDDYAFDGCSNIKSITLHDGLVSIGKYAFRNCSAEIIWGENPTVATISDYAFSNYGGSSIKIPASVSSVGEKAFGGCNALTRVDITDLAAWCKIAFKSADANPLYYSYNLYLDDNPVTELTIPGSVTEIKQYAFYNCNKITKLTLSGNVTSIGKGAFTGCNAIEGVYISDISAWCKIAFESANANPLSIAHNLFVGSESKPEEGAAKPALTIPSAVTAIKQYAFYGCTNRSSISMSAVTSIGSYAFQKCTAEIKFDGNTSITTIAGYAFAGYEGEKINIPSSVTEIKSEAFKDCKNLTGVYITDLAAWCKIAFESENAHPLYYTEQKHLYRNGSLLTTLDTAAINGNVEIKNYAFYNCLDLTQIVDSKGTITSIGERSFAGCTHLKTVNISAITEIGQSAFSSCNSIETVTIGNKITKIEANAFLNAFKAADQGVIPKVTINKTTATVNNTKLTLRDAETNAEWLSGGYSSYDWTF